MMKVDYSPYMRIKFKPLGRTIEGCDCYGLVKLLYTDLLGISLQDYLGYNITDREQVNDKLDNGQKSGDWEEVTKPEFGNVILLSVAGLPRHVGFMISKNEFIHIQRLGGVKITRLTDPATAPRIKGFFRYVGKGNL